MERKSKFDEFLLMAIDEVLKDTFGEAGLLINTYLKLHSVKREEIPEKLETFADCLEKFSAEGAVLEAMILRNMYSSVGLEFKHMNEHRRFVDSVAELKDYFH
jgi:hypothetical protein